MERIQEAIQRAKKNRQSRVPASSGAAPLVVKPQVDVAAINNQNVMLKTNRQHLESCRILAPTHVDPYRPAFDMLRTKVTQQLSSNGWQVMLMTSPSPGCGKTVTAINLALSIARQPHQHVCLVDLDLRKPRVAHYLGVKPRYELQHVLEGHVRLTDALFSIDIGGPQLSFLTTTRPMHSSTEILMSGQMQSVVQDLRNTAARPIIIVDMPPVLVSDDVLAFAQQSDCCLLAVAEGQSTIKDIEKSEKLLENINFLGCVLTKSNERVESYYY
jgi:protein-tyrosine kinase